MRLETLRLSYGLERVFSVSQKRKFETLKKNTWTENGLAF